MKDECFAAYLHDNDFLRQVLPISSGANVILKKIFHLNPLRRITLPELRKEILKLDTFYMTDDERLYGAKLVQAPQAAVKGPGPGKKERGVVAERVPVGNTRSNDSGYVDPEEVYVFSSPPDSPRPPPAAVANAVADVKLVQKTKEFSVGSESPPLTNQGSGSSSGDSDGPITPATYPIDPGVDVPDLPDGESLDQPAVFTAVAAAPKSTLVANANNPESHKVPSKHTNLFRMAFRHIRGIPAGTGPS